MWTIFISEVEGQKITEFAQLAELQSQRARLKFQGTAGRKNIEIEQWCGEPRKVKKQCRKAWKE